jgi:hypothetical protein
MCTCDGRLLAQRSFRLHALSPFNVGRRARHIEEDDDFPAWLAPETATMFFHAFVAGGALRFHWHDRHLLPCFQLPFNSAEATGQRGARLPSGTGPKSQIREIEIRAKRREQFRGL